MNKTTANFLIIDIGTGNVRASIVNAAAEVIAIDRQNVNYQKDEHYSDALALDPNQLWNQIKSLCKNVTSAVPSKSIQGITVSSQREGIILVDKNLQAITGLPNHDHRGKDWEDQISSKEFIYEKCGRYPSSIFSALKMVGFRDVYPDVYTSIGHVLSISDWVQYKLCNVMGYEHSQASETLLYDVELMKWSKNLCALFEIDIRLLPPLHSSGDVLGPILPELSHDLNLAPNTPVIVGGADTQLAIKSTRPKLRDIVIVAGTTTPLVTLTKDYIVDKNQKTWTNRHVEKDLYILETNAGVTGLNYQRIKEIFYPNEGYDIIEQELDLSKHNLCSAALGSIISNEDKSITRGGFIIDTPISHALTRVDFVKAAFIDIGNCIEKNLSYLQTVNPNNTTYVWGCGGGFQSPYFCQLLANLLHKKIRIRSGFQHASIIGAMLICCEALGIQKPLLEDEIIEYLPNPTTQLAKQNEMWQETRNALKQTFN